MMEAHSHPHLGHDRIPQQVMQDPKKNQQYTGSQHRLKPNEKRGNHGPCRDADLVGFLVCVGLAYGSEFAIWLCSRCERSNTKATTSCQSTRTVHKRLQERP